MAEKILTQEQEDIKKDVFKYSSIKAIMDQPGGRILREALMSDITGVVDQLAGSYRTLPHVELQALCAKLESKLELLQSLSNSATNAEDARNALELSLQDPE